jgi:hypothetical protein
VELEFQATPFSSSPQPPIIQQDGQRGFNTRNNLAGKQTIDQARERVALVDETPRIFRIGWLPESERPLP